MYGFSSHSISGILLPFVEGSVHAVQEDTTTIKVSWTYTEANQGFKIEITEDGVLLESKDAAQADKFVQIRDVYPVTDYKFMVKVLQNNVETSIGESQLTTWPGGKLTLSVTAKTKSEMKLGIEINIFIDEWS